MRKMYANLLGRWVDLHSDPKATVFESDPSLYIEEQLQDMFEYNYVNIYFEGIEYRIHPSLIQVITTKTH